MILVHQVSNQFCAMSSPFNCGPGTTQKFPPWSRREWNALKYFLIYTLIQGWGQFHFFNSIPIPIPLFSIPIPIPLLTISFNSNSNSNSGDFNSNSDSNSGDFKSRKSQFQKWPIDVFLEIDYNHTNKVHVYNIIVVNIISLISFVSYINMASWLILYQ